MEDNASSSTKPDQQLSLQEPEHVEEKIQKKAGGTYCCVRFCDHNTKGNPELSFHKLPTESKLRKAWLHWIGRVDFQPTQYHRVCSKHFEGGKKTYSIKVPTIGPKLIQPMPSKVQPIYKFRERDSTLIPTVRKG